MEQILKRLILLQKKTKKKKKGLLKDLQVQKLF